GNWTGSTACGKSAPPPPAPTEGSLGKRARRVGFAAPLPTDVIWYVETALHYGRCITHSEGPAMSAPRITKKYPNRRLYDTVESRYITLADIDRKSTRLNSSHVSISYAVF